MRRPRHIPRGRPFSTEVPVYDFTEASKQPEPEKANPTRERLCASFVISFKEGSARITRPHQLIYVALPLNDDPDKFQPFKIVFDIKRDSDFPYRLTMVTPDFSPRSENGANLVCNFNPLAISDFHFYSRTAPTDSCLTKAEAVSWLERANDFLISGEFGTDDKKNDFKLLSPSGSDLFIDNDVPSSFTRFRVFQIYRRLGNGNVGVIGGPV